MPFAAHLSTEADTDAALTECLSRLNWQEPVDLGLTFYSPHHRRAVKEIGRRLHEVLRPRCLLGCPGETIIGNEREVEKGPALAVWFGRWDGPVQLTPFHLYPEETPDGITLLGYPDELNEATPADSMVLALADPFSFPVDDFLRQWNEEKPGLRVVGGMASGARQPGKNPLLVSSAQPGAAPAGAEVGAPAVVSEGAVCVLLRGEVRVRTVVSQGCRPIGRPMVITKARDNIIYELGGKPALVQLQELWQELPPRDQDLVRQGLHVGRVISEYQEKFQRGDFLVRNVMGFERESGAVAITERVRTGQTVQFHVRDAQTADEDLHLLLQHDRATHRGQAAAALLFSCNGRGTRLFDQPDHDAQAIQREIGPLPLAGFFAQGELGPIGGQNFIHGFTASVLLFE